MLQDTSLDIKLPNVWSWAVMYIIIQQCVFYTQVSGFGRANSKYMVFFMLLYNALCFSEWLLTLHPTLNLSPFPSHDRLPWDSLVDCINEIKAKHAIFIQNCYAQMVSCTAGNPQVNNQNALRMWKIKLYPFDNHRFITWETMHRGMCIVAKRRNNNTL